ncbi:MAG: hypothetical protein J7L88_05410, partial [Thermoplasmata archaeon]|nr:hypothetical protein [Thermoplasmata archaeon]
MPENKNDERGGGLPLLSLFFMLALYFLTLLLSLWISPLFLRSGFQAFGEEGAFNVKWALCYVVFFLIFSLALLYIIKKKKKRPVKYALILSLWVGLFYTLIPLYTAGFSSWEWETLEVNDALYSTQTSENSAFLLTTTGPLIVMSHDNVIEIRRW